jgi:hypothetical protein
VACPYCGRVPTSISLESGFATSNRFGSWPGVATADQLEMFLDCLAAGMTVEEIIAEYPTLTVAGVRAAAAYGAALAREELLPLLHGRSHGEVQARREPATRTTSHPPSVTTCSAPLSRIPHCHLRSRTDDAI